MTEGHAAHGIARRLRQLAGLPVRSSSPNGSFAASRFHGSVLDDADAIGKHLFVAFEDDDTWVHAHLAMRGRWSVRLHHRALNEIGLPRTEPPVRGSVAWRLLSAHHHAELTQPSVCELIDGEAFLALRARLGPDPLRDDADPADVLARITRSRRPIGQLIVDQSVIAGVGNVYRAELLHRARLDPFAPGCSLDDATVLALWHDTVRLMRLGLDAGWIVSSPRQVAAATEVLRGGERVPRWRKEYAVYGRAGYPCHVCGATVRSMRLGLQRLFWCPGCQAPGHAVASDLGPATRAWAVAAETDRSG